MTDVKVEGKHCSTQVMVADMLTNGLPKNVFMKLHAVIGLLVKCSGNDLGGVLKRAL